MNTFLKITLVLVLLIGLQAPAVNISYIAFAQEVDTQEQPQDEVQTQGEGEGDEKTQGDKGDKGADGEEGESGEEGGTADEGNDGKEGEDGQNGDNGEPAEDEPAQDGDSGEQGDGGENGETGDPGDTGEDGGPQEDGEDGGDADHGTEGGDGGNGGNGEEGENGEDAAGDDEDATEGDTVVETGDATSGGAIHNTGNTNVVNGDGSVSTGEQLPFCSDKSKDDKEKGGKDEKDGTKDGKDDEEDAGAEHAEDEPRCIEKERSSDTEVDNENAAQAENTAAGEADTGNNEASNNNGSSTVDTGDALGMLDIFNLLNTNIIDSNGLFVLLSNLQQQLLDIDLRDWAPYLEGYDETCNASCYTFGDLEVTNNNSSTITNNVTVNANTGGNKASGNAGGGTITTGDAYAGANVVNIANTNIIDSNYLLFIANNFGNFFGDIVFPNASSLFTSMFSSPSTVYDETKIENNNTANISNNVAVNAETGGNEAYGGNGGFIQTGDANSAVNVFNQANMNLLGGNSFVALIRVSGDWSGDVFGLPEGISWKQTPNGIMLYSDDMPVGVSGEADSANQDESLPCETCEEGDRSKGSKGKKGGKSDLSVENENNATINNNVQVFALTGDNKANGNGAGGSITTGDAQAVANVVNIANTNVIGKNWLFAMFNILGDFNGNISFGRPDLWIGQRAEIPNDPALPGDEITYYLTVSNNGDAPAHNVSISSIFDDLLLSFGNAIDHTSFDTGEVLWDLGTLLPGEGMEVSFTGTIRSDIPFGTSSLGNSSTVHATESDDNTEDNTDVVELEIFNQEPAPPPSGGGGGGSGGGGSDGGGDGNSGSGGSGGGGSANTSSFTGNAQSNDTSGQAPNLVVTKTHSIVGDIYPGDAVDYTIVVSNMNGGSAFDAVLYDELENENGDIVHEEIWELGEVFPDEEITVTYSVIFENDAKSGVYYNNAYVDAANGFSNVAVTSLQLENINEFLLSVDKELERIRAELGMQEGGAVLLPGESSPGSVLLSYVPSNDISEQKIAEEQEQSNPFFASLAGLLQGFGNWLMIPAAVSSILLFILLRRRNLRRRN